MIYKAPKKTTWLVALILGVISLIASLFTLGILTTLSPFIALAGLALMLVATTMEGL